MDTITRFLINNIMSLISLIISLIVLFIQVKSNKVQKKLYYFTIDGHLDSNAVIKLVSAQQINDKVSIKLVIYNLDSKPLLIQSLQIFQKVKSKNIIKKLLNIEEYLTVPDSYWWPKFQSESVETKRFADEYQNILIKDLMDFQIVLHGELYKDLYINDKDIYYFVVKTNRGAVTVSSPLNINGCYFSHSYNESRSYDC